MLSNLVMHFLLVALNNKVINLGNDIFGNLFFKLWLWASKDALPNFDMSSKFGPDFSTKITSKLKLPNYQKKSDDFWHRKFSKFTLKVQFPHFAMRWQSILRHLWSRTMANWIAEGVASEVNDYSTPYIAKFLGKILYCATISDS